MAALTSLNITNLIVNVEPSSVPSTLQRTGAIVSVGATTLTAGTTANLTQASSLTPILANTIALSAIAWASTGGGTVTATCPTESLVVGDEVTVLGCVPTGYNGTVILTAVTATTFSYALASTPGTATTVGSYTPGAGPELVNQVGSFYGQGNQIPVLVLELGELTVPAAITALGNYINNNLGTIYGFLIPREWTTSANAAALEAMLLNYNAPSAMVYFYGTATQSQASAFPQTLKCLRLMIESPTIAATEFSMATVFSQQLNLNPSATNQLTPAAYAFLFGVTAWPQQGNQTTLLALLNSNLNYVGTGAEANIANTILRNGTGMDGYGFNIWYTIDYVQIQEGIQNTAAVINGSNNPEAPLGYDQAGINTLLAVLQGVITTAVSFGMINPNAPITIGATSFSAYVAANPADYEEGIYRGLSATFTPLGGFISVTINFTVNLTA